PKSRNEGGDVIAVTHYEHPPTRMLADCRRHSCDVCLFFPRCRGTSLGLSPRLVARGCAVSWVRRHWVVMTMGRRLGSLLKARLRAQEREGAIPNWPRFLPRVAAEIHVG